MPGPSGFDTTPVEESDVVGFRSGTPELDAYFAKHAVANDRRGIGKTFVLRRREDEPGLPAVIGYYTLSMADLDVSVLPAKARRGLPKYPMPVALVGRLAVDERARGRGHGGRLLADALARIVAVAGQIGCYGVIVDAKEEEALSFYEHYGFAAIGPPAFPRRMFLPAKTLLDASS